MTGFDPSAPFRMLLDRNAWRPVNKLAALALVMGSLLACLGCLYDSMWMRIAAVLLWFGGTLSLFGFRRSAEANKADKDSPGPHCLY